MTQDYKRNGTTTSFAALSMLGHKVIGARLPQHRHCEFLRFLQESFQDLQVYLVADEKVSNNAHRSQEQTLAEVAARLRKSPRWLQTLLAEDRRRPPRVQRYQFHSYIGRTPVWTEGELLRAAIKAEIAKEKSGGAQLGSRSLNAMDIGMFMGRSTLKDAESALEEVLTFPPSRPAMRTHRRSGAGSKKTFAASSTTNPGQVLTSPLRPRRT
jgi:hypothetical protein